MTFKKRFLINLFIFTIVVFFTIILLFIHSGMLSSIIFTGFYVIIYSLGIFNFISFINIIILGLIFDSIGNISIGVSSTLLLAIILCEKIEKGFLPKVKDSVFTCIALALINFALLLLLAKGLAYFFSVAFISPLSFYLISVPFNIISITVFKMLHKYNAG